MEHTQGGRYTNTSLTHTQPQSSSIIRRRLYPLLTNAHVPRGSRPRTHTHISFTMSSHLLPLFIDSCCYQDKHNTAHQVQHTHTAPLFNQQGRRYSGHRQYFPTMVLPERCIPDVRAFEPPLNMSSQGQKLPSSLSIPRTSLLTSPFIFRAVAVPAADPSLPSDVLCTRLSATGVAHSVSR